MAERRYDEREVGLILQKVAALSEGQGGRAGEGLTREEIEEVVGELGMSKALVARATAALDDPAQHAAPPWWLGGRDALAFEDEVKGPVDDATFEAMVARLRRLLASPGGVERDGASRIWRSRPGTTREVHLIVTETRDGARLRLAEQMPVDARTTVGMSAGAGLMSGAMGVIPLKAILGSVLVKLAIVPVIGAGVLAGWGVGRMIWKRRAAEREEGLARAFADICDLARQARRALPRGDTDGAG